MCLLTGEGDAPACVRLSSKFHVSLPLWSLQILLYAPRTQGRLLHWSPAVASKKAISSSHPEVSARFVKESALSKGNNRWLPDVDMIDCNVREESLNYSGRPVLLQLPLVPCYARVLFNKCVPPMVSHTFVERVC